jgi:hypothetical protein
MVERLVLTLTAHHAHLPQLLIFDPLAPLDLAGDDCPPSPDLASLPALALPLGDLVGH